MKYSKQRNLILNTVVENPIHPTADQVYTQIKEKNPSISLGTVYRNLKLLSQIGQLRRICVPNGSDRFDGRIERHFHIICESCGKVYDVENHLKTDIERHVEKETGYRVNEIDVVMYGICSDCQVKV